MGRRNVPDVNVVPYAGPVQRLVIAPKHLDPIASSQHSVNDFGDQVRFRLVILAQALLRPRTGGIEIPESDVLQAVGRMVILQHFFHLPLCPAVWVDRVEPVNPPLALIWLPYTAADEE